MTNPDSIWASDGIYYTYDDGLSDSDVKYLLATPSREHADELAEALNDVLGRLEVAAKDYHNTQRWYDEEGPNGEPDYWSFITAPADTVLAKIKEQAEMKERMDDTKG